MNPEDLDLPQPPEGILDPQVPWSRINPNSRLWVILKARLTGRPQGSENYSSYVNITEADADRLIANMKKDPRGYPSLDQTSGNPVQWMERQRIYQEWLVEEYLEKPFRKQVDAKIEEAEIERVVNKRRSENIQPQEPLVKPMEPIPDPWEGSYVNSSEIKPPEPIIEPEPVEPAAETPEPEVPVEDTLPKKPEKPERIPTKIPNRAKQNITEFSAALDKISAELSAHIVLVQRRKSVLRTSNQGLQLAQFLIGQQIENYSEFLDDLETKSREESIELGVDTPDIEKPKAKPVPKVPDPKPDTPPKKQWWEIWKPDTKSKPQSPRKASAGLMSTSMPAMAEGGVSKGTGGKNIIKPGIYDNPTVGNLAPGTAVIPLNRNYGKDMFGNYDEIEYMNALGESMLLSRKGLLGSVLSVYASILESLGPLAGYFNRSLPGLVQSVSSVLDAPANAVLNMLGGPAYAGTEPNEKDQKYFYKSWRVYMNENNLYFPGAGGPFGGKPKTDAEFAKDILTIGPGGEGLSRMGGTNVGKAPAWIPFSKDAAGKLEYSSGFGRRWGKQHSGIDLAGEPGIKIISPFAGEVFDMNNTGVGGGGYGNFVGIKHDSPKIFTFYGHLQKVADSIEVGKKVTAGQVIGTLGNTGRSTGPHLHWEIRTTQTGGQIDPVQWTHENKPSFAGGGWLKVAQNIASKFIKPKGLSIKGVQAGFTGMNLQGFKAIMGGDKFRLGKWKPQILGRGAYSAPTIKGAQRYSGASGSLGGKQIPGGVVKTIVPGSAPRISIIEPQARVAPTTFDKGKILADKLLSGAYSNSPLANKLRSQLISGSATTAAKLSPLVKLAGRFFGILNAPVIGDMIMPEGTAAYDQITGPNAYYNAPGYSGPKPTNPSPVTTTPVATQSKPAPKVTNIQMPSKSTPTVVSKPSSSMAFVNLQMETNMVMEMEMLRRVQ